MIKKSHIFFGISIFVLLALIAVSLGLGRYHLNLSEVIQGLLYQNDSGDKTVLLVLWKIRVPRIIMAVLVGAGLSVSGATLQAIFGNPLVSEHILGVSSGAGFGAALGILLWHFPLGIEFTSVFFGLTAMGFASIIARKNGRIRVLMLVLSGIIVSSIFSSGISLLKYFADTEQELPAIVFWLMGGLANTTLETVYKTAPVIIICCLILYKIRWQLNLVSIHEEAATSLGVNVRLIRSIAILSATLITATSVAACGMITFIGLVIPHFTRMILGNDNKSLIPGVLVVGAIFLLFVDNFARNITSAEIPLSILTSVIGAPFFAHLLHKTGGVWND